MMKKRLLAAVMSAVLAVSPFVTTAASVSAVSYTSPYVCYNDFVKNFKYDLNKNYIETAVQQIRNSNDYKRFIGSNCAGEFITVRKIGGSLNNPDSLEVNLVTYSNYYGFQPSYIDLSNGRLAINVCYAFDAYTPPLYEFHYRFDNPDGRKKGNVKNGTLVLNPDEHTAYINFSELERREIYFYKTDNIFAKGDVNRDNKVNVTDITLVAAHVKGIKVLSDESFFLADVDNSGTVNVTDVTKIAAQVKGKKTLK